MNDCQEKKYVLIKICACKAPCCTFVLEQKINKTSPLTQKMTEEATTKAVVQ